MKIIKNFFLGAIIGLILSYLLGILLAPNMGSQTRNILNQKITDIAQQVKQAITQRRKELEEEIHTYSK